MTDRRLSDETNVITTLAEDDLLLVSQKDGATYADATIKAGSLVLPAFRASPSGAQSINDATLTVVICDTEQIDTGNYHDTTTGKFTPLIAGTYSFCGYVSMTGLADNKIATTAIRKNGTTVSRVGRASTDGVYDTIAGGPTLFFLNGSTDYVELAVSHTHGSARNTVAADTRWSGYRVSPDDICGV
jgi:hypothetical protein